ncbi:hydrolase-like protein [Leishmania tarentolae]|uniref:Hydrolase-like protein n=1 Tax=Leishmania tarentolae TaxID=5689 RepID=A0A640KDK5_LEITA|nr:hydrolase-like protein [Leishmania tarentolae]
MLQHNDGGDAVVGDGATAQHPLTALKTPARPEDMNLPPAVLEELSRLFPRPPEEGFACVGRCASTGKEVTLCYSVFGDPADPCILLIMGMNATSLMWDIRFCGYLAAAGFYVIRYDNRDVGLSTHFDEYSPPFILRMVLPTWASIGEGPLAYTLDDMAEDAAGLLKALKISQAHIVGCSMGGMIAQLLTLRHPEMVASLCLHSTSAGSPWPRASVLLNILDQPENTRDVHSVLDYRVRFFKAVAGDMTFHEREFRLGMWFDFVRAPYQGGARRHLAAIVRAKDRSAALRAYINQGTSTMASGSDDKRGSSSPPASGTAPSRCIPVVVLHGGKDPLVVLSNGQHLASCIKGARLVVFPKMGHYFSKDMFRPIADEVILNARTDAAAMVNALPS